ncbi:MAG: porin family protein [Bacteroidia bacterium]
MKNKIFTLAIILGGIAANAQENNTDFRNRLIVGAKAGINYSNVYDSKGQTFHANPKLGFAGGAFLAIPFGKLFGLQPEILYSQKGFQSSGAILGSNYNMTRTSNYIDAPLFFAFKPSEFLTVLAGPQFSYLVSQKNTFVNGSTSQEQEIAFDNDDIRNNTLCFAGGIDLTLKHIVFGARVGWDVQQNNDNGSSTILRYKNTWYQATIGYRFYKH